MVTTLQKPFTFSESMKALLDTLTETFAPAEADAIRRACESAEPI